MPSTTPWRTAARRPGPTSRRHCSATAIRTIRRTRRRPHSSWARSAFRRGGIPLHSHKFYVNATPRVADVDFANTNTSTPPTTGNDWRTILVGGLGAGGRAVYALDVTDPVAAPPPVVSSDTEATAAIESAVGVHGSESGLRLRRADARQDVRLRLGRARCLRVQQPRRQGLPLRPESERHRPRRVSC